MIVLEYKCNRCGQVIPQDKIERYGTQLAVITKKHLFQIKHLFKGGEKDVQHWRSAIFCTECEKKLEETYNNFIEEGKKEIKNAD